MKSKFPLFKQHDSMDCGPSCLRMIAKYYGKNFSLNSLREASYLTREGVSLQGISYAAESIGLRTFGSKITLKELVNKAPLPCIVHWEENHFVVVHKATAKKIYVADPAKGLLSYKHESFVKKWTGRNELEARGIVLLLSPSPLFYEKEESNKQSWSFFFKYLRPHKYLFIQVLFALIFGTILSLITPFLTQATVDVGINNNDLNFVLLILGAQLMLTLGSTFVSYIQSWILLHVGTRISIVFISDFIMKILKLPLHFFETKSIGDILQRMSDNGRVQSFITSSLFTIILSLLNFIIFSLILGYYNLTLLTIFLVGNFFYVIWVLIFMKKRREFDYKGFELNAQSNNKILQLFNGIEDIKLNNIERTKRWEWENVQILQYKLSIKTLLWGQFQSSGSLLINSVKNILMSFIAAKSVIEGSMTLGMMLSVQYIIGQLQGPINAFIGLVHSYQDAKISIERLGEVHEIENEDTKESNISEIPSKADLMVENLSFQYEGPDSPFVINNLSCIIPHNKVTAIVGASGSGKTTLLKLLLKFYKPTSGIVKLNKTNISNISSELWRMNCGTVMQSSYIFDDTIEKNIAIDDSKKIDYQKLHKSVRIANIDEWIESLPLNYKTKIGNEGNGLSQGQKQRLLIARAIYKNPQYLFLDEATNSLDATNERSVMEKLRNFFNNKTVIIVAHRLSTVKNADQILVLNQGEIIERGTHESLVNKKGYYFNLIKDQLEVEDS